MFNLSNAPTVPLDDEELSGEADEPPDSQIYPLNTPFQRDGLYSRWTGPANSQRESLLTRAIMAESKSEETTVSAISSRGLSTTSSRSTGSMASTAELTSDGDVTSPSRSATPSPPLPPRRYSGLLNLKKQGTPTSRVVIAPVTKDDKPAVADVGEAAIEKTLGRKRCIMFACGGTESEKSRDNVSSPTKASVDPEMPRRKCMLTFACPTRTESNERKESPSKLRVEQKSARRPSPAPTSVRRSNSGSADLSGRSVETAKPSSPERPRPNPPAHKVSFHEFGSSHDETDSWVDRPTTQKPKLTLDDCMQKELRIRDIGRQAEEEAEEEEREQEELEAELEDNDNEDDFAPSDDDSASDGGNESDDEGGFASSDDDSDAGSEYQFWAPATNIARGSMEHMHLRHFSSRQHSPASSIESLTHSASPPLHFRRWQVRRGRRQAPVPRLRPGTPELPDSTDFVCGTLDEDRPLEAAYISCREQKKRAKHVPVPQDIDPSFPTTDPDEEEDECDDENIDELQHSSDDVPWLKDQFAGFEHDTRGHRTSPVLSPQHHSPPGHIAFAARQEPRRGIRRSPPPPKHTGARSPPPRKLFGHSPSRLRSPPPPARLRSPRGSPTYVDVPSRLGTRGLAQRPTMVRTASLPDTPNPFFRNFNIGSPSISNIASGAVTPVVEGPPRLDMHVRGPVDIVMGLEKKRQKRKEKFLRQHYRKAKEQGERRLTRGRGAERMKELGLECAERLKGYGVGQQTQLVLSL